ncbi:hypothetical protein E8E14_006987, partial [Neopestalotiopsis sp. 37M]
TPALSHITAIAVDPGNLSDSRALRSNTPKQLALMQRYALQPLRPLLRFMDPTIRTSAKAGSGVIELGIGVVQPKQRGFFNFLEQGESSPESLNEQKQENLWAKSNLDVAFSGKGLCMINAELEIESLDEK